MINTVQNYLLANENYKFMILFMALFIVSIATLWAFARIKLATQARKTQRNQQEENIQRHASRIEKLAHKTFNKHSSTESIGSTTNGYIGYLQKKLLLAGYYDKYTIYHLVFFQLLYLLLGLVLIFLLQSVFFQGYSLLLQLIIYIGILTLCIILPIAVLNSHAKNRQKAIKLVLPDLIDYLVIYISAGRNLNNAFEELAILFRSSSPILAKELAITNSELNLFASHQQALNNLASRNDFEQMHKFVKSIKQYQQLGTNINESLIKQADQLRETQYLTAQRHADKIPVYIILITSLFFLPVMLIVAFGTVFLNFYYFIQGFIG